MRSFKVLSFALTLTLLLAFEAMGQSGSASITLNGHVSEAVFVSIAPGAQLSGDSLQLTYVPLNTHTVRLSIHTHGSDSRRISIPLQLRSNVSYTLSASATSGETRLSKLCVTGARATGKFVANGAIEGINAIACEAATFGARLPNVRRDAPPFSSPSTLLSGARISRAGTFDAPFNALEVMLLIEVEPQDGQQQGSVELILSAAPAGQSLRKL